VIAVSLCYNIVDSAIIILLNAMYNEPWKGALLELSVDELKTAQNFISELIQTLEVLQESKAEPIVIFPPEKNVNIDERRADKRFNIEIEGVCSIVERKESEIFTEIPIRIKDISRHGIRFVIDQPLIPSDILIIKFYLSSIKTTGQLYKNPQKKIYVEVRRVFEFLTSEGVKYEIGAQSVEGERVAELIKEREKHTLISKQLAAKGDVKILIVSIKEARAKYLEDMLQKQGYIVYEANKKQQAIALLRKNKCDIVVSDLDTVRINEFELLKDIRDEFPDTGSIVEIETIEDWMHILPLGVSDYLTKNFSDREFNIIIESVHKKLLYKSMFGSYFRRRQQASQNVLVLGGNEVFKKVLCNASKEKGLRLFFVNAEEHATTALKRYKIDFIITDTAITGLDGCRFITAVKKNFPNIMTVVVSKSLQERCDFLVSGADNFLVEPIATKEVFSLVG
jgi:DNA-binding response OmpR family regulator